MVGAQSDDAPATALFQLSPDRTEYRRLDHDGVAVETFAGRRFLTISPDAVSALTAAAFEDVSHLFRPGHLAQVASILDDRDASPNDRFVAMELLKNAVIAAARAFPSCQDTGTAIVVAKKGQEALVDGDMHGAIWAGISEVWSTRNLRFSQMAPLSMFEEVNTGNNLPAQIDIEAVSGSAIDFLFIAKGGGSANKTFLYQETRRVLEPERLAAFFEEKIRTLGTAACPPYHLALVIGGLSAEQTLKTVKLASTRALDDLPRHGDKTGRAFRDVEMEQQIHALAGQMGLGAQFGGKYFCHDVRVVRLPRHGGSLPIGLGVSCSADRQVKGRIDQGGLWLERLETDPARFLPTVSHEPGQAVRVDLDRPMDEIRKTLSALDVATPVLMSGTVIVARDLVHAEWAKLLAEGGPEALPSYMRDHPIYYAGPAKTPRGYASGSFGPTTAARMDPYIPEFQAHGASLVTIAKGNRSRAVRESCKRHGGFYLGSIGGAAAVLGRDVIEAIDVIDFGDFGMEAVFKIRVRDFPAFVIINDNGDDFFGRMLPS